MSNSKDLTAFIQEDLYPALFPKIGEIFPEMDFKKVGSKWISSHYLNGTSTEGSKFRKDKTVVTANRIGRALEQGGDSKDLLSLYMDFNNISSPFLAAKQLSEKLSLPNFPEDEESKARWEEARAKIETLSSSYERQKAALFAPEGAEALKYLKEKRGYSEENIRKMGLGFLSPKEGAFLEEKLKIGYYKSFEDFPLSIPFYSGGRLRGFKLRYISEEAAQKYGNQKYRNTANLNGTIKKEPFGLAPWNVGGKTKGERTLIAVEGDLDALHAIAEGAENITATAGGWITEEMAQAIKAKGYSNVILTLDTDGAGQQFTEKSIEILLNAGINAYVATLPDAKDTDEYLNKHSIEEFRKVLLDCTQAVYFLFRKEVERYNSTPRTPIDFDKFTDNVISLSLRAKDEILRGRILDSLKGAFGISGEEAYKGFRQRADRLRAEQTKEAALKASDTAIKEAANLLSQGKREEAKEKTGEALEQMKRAEGEDKYSSLLNDNTEELWNRYKHPSKTLDTGYIFWKDKKNYPEDFIKLSFPAGGISVIGAATGHGKSKMLQSLTLDALEAQWEKGIILYITYEENEEQVNEQFLNALANVELTKKGGNAQLRIIDDYLRSFPTDPSILEQGKNPQRGGITINSGGAKTKSVKDKFLEAEERWKGIRKGNRIRIIKPDDNFLETLMGILDYAKENLPLRAVFIDYIQELYIEDFKKMRTDELKEIMVELDLFAQNARIPVIAGAQLKRETASPADLFNNMMDSSGWIERKASEIILIWSSNHEIKKEEKAKIKDVIPDPEEAAIFLSKQEGRLFLKVTKSRLISINSTAVVKINGKTGRVTPNGELPKAPGAKEGEIDFSGTEARPIDDNVKIDPEAQRPYRRGREEEQKNEAPNKYREELKKIIELCDITGLGTSYEELEKKLHELGYSGTSMVTGSSKAERIIKDGVTEGLLIYRNERYFYKGNYTEEAPKNPIPGIEIKEPQREDILPFGEPLGDEDLPF